MLRSFAAYIYTFVGLTASLITIWLFTKNVYPKFASDTRVAALFLGLFGVYYFVETLILKLRWGRSEKYRQATNLIFDGLSDVHALAYQFQDNKNPDVEKIVPALKRLCNYLANAFTLTTSTRCSVTIKLVKGVIDEGGLSRLGVETICRDDRSTKWRKSPNETNNWLEDNTDFHAIFEKIDSPSDRYFYSDQLPFLYSYQNTSFAAYGLPKDRETLILLLPFRLLSRYLKWPLPYKSTLVVPIMDQVDSGNLVGFLCVDSPSLGAFRVDYDKKLLVGVAEALSYSMSLLLVG